MPKKFNNEFNISGSKPEARAYALTDVEYAKCLDNVVKVSIDTFISNSKGEVLLGERVDWPVKGLWCFGGRMIPREIFAETVVRNIQRELNYKIENPEEIKMVGWYSFVWDKRREAPEENGFHDLLIFMHYVLPDHASIQPDHTHSKIKWYTKEELLKEKDNLHPYLVTGLKDALLI